MNRYPMKATIDGKVVRNLRLVDDEDGNGVTVWGWDREAAQGTVLLTSETPPERVGATTSWKVGELTLDEQRGCGCNHPMYTWVPPRHTIDAEA